jgi:hypothetical protein
MILPEKKNTLHSFGSIKNVVHSLKLKKNIRRMKRRSNDFKNVYWLLSRNIILPYKLVYSVMKRFVIKRCVILALCSEHNTTFFPSAHGVPASRDFALWKGGGGQWGGLLFIPLRYVLYSDIDVTPLPLGWGSLSSSFLPWLSGVYLQLQYMYIVYEYIPLLIPSFVWICSVQCMPSRLQWFSQPYGIHQQKMPNETF